MLAQGRGAGFFDSWFALLHKLPFNLRPHLGTQAKNLAEIDLEIGELDGKIAAVEKEIEQLRKENA